jgi:hypothetical protein
LGIFLLILALSCVAFGQGTTSRITGVVTDKTGAVIAGANVTATNEGTNASFKATSSATGVYVFDSLQVGKYTITAEFQGFKKYVSTGNVLEIGAPIAVHVTMEVGATGDVVEVQGGYELVQTDSSGNFGSIVDNKSMTSMPIVGIRGRNPLAFVTLVPGVDGGSYAQTGGGVTVHGSRDRAWNYTLDGIDVNESTSGGGNTTPTRANPDSISEFKLITGSFTSEYGRNSGGQVTMVTKSGTNRLHGTAFWFYQSPFLQANSSPIKSQQKIAGKPNQRAQFIQHIPGFSVGGPIKKDKTFFFANMQLLHARNSYLVTNNVYTQLARQGKFRYAVGGRNQPAGVSNASVDASGNPIVNVATYDMVANDPQHIGLDPAIQKYLGVTPLPNNFTVGDGLNTAGYTFVPQQLEKQVELTLKIDHTFSPSNAVFVRWYNGHQNTIGDTANSGLQTFPGLPNIVDTYRKPRNLAVNWRWSPTAKTTNEFVLGVNYFGYLFSNPDEANVANVPPFIFTNVTTPQSSWVNNNRFALTYQLVDNFTYARGSHTYKFGFNGRYLREIDQRGSVGTLNAEPQVYFATSDNPVDTKIFNLPATGSGGINSSSDLPRLQSTINDILGRIGQIQQGYVAMADLQTFKPARSYNNMDHRWPEYDFYGQDSWKIRRNLTLDYGVRWEIRLAPHLASFPDLVPNQSVLWGAVPSGNLQFVKGELYKSDWNNLGPSIGLAWDPFEDGKTSVRANYRVAFDRINPFSFSSSVFQGMPGLTYQMIDTTSGQAGMRAANWKIPPPPAGLTPMQLTTLPAYSTQTLTVSDPNLRTPKVYMWGLSVQREIFKNMVFSLTYNGRHGVGLYGGYDANMANYRTNGFLEAFKTVAAGGESAVFDQLFAKKTGKLATESGAAYARRSYASYLNGNQVYGLANLIANTTQGGVPLVVLDGLSPYFFKPYPQALGGMKVLDTMDYSVYHDLEAQIERRFTNGLSFQLSWTWQKSLDTRSYDPAFTTIATNTSAQSGTGTPYDFHSPHLNWGPSDFDRTHVLQANWVYELPFGKGKMFGSGVNRLVDEFIGGWEVAGNWIYETGRPINFLANGYTFGQTYAPASCTGKCDPYVGATYWDTNANQQFYLRMAPLTSSTTGLDANLCRQSADGSFALCTPKAGEFSNIGRNFFRQNIYTNTNATIAKTFKIREGHTLQARLEMQNVMNLQNFDTFGSQTITSSVFARQNQATDDIMSSSGSQRRMQLSLKYTF